VQGNNFADAESEEGMRDTIDMAREAGDDWDSTLSTDKEFLKRFQALVRADEREEFQRWFDAVTAQHKQEILAEREACAKVCEEFARKWWKIHCDSNLHYSSTLKAHQDFCALQAAIRARGAKHD
jgi:hypothetical protein